MSLRETLEKIRSAPAPQNEETAKFQIIAPILSSLGWNPFGPHVKYEHPVGGKGGRVDMALAGPDDHLVAMIEAKRPGADLNKYVAQVLGYAFHDGVDICFLTTGLAWWLYLPREGGRPSQRRFATLMISEDPIEQLARNFRTFLGRDSLLTGRAVSEAKHVLEELKTTKILTAEIPRVWQRMQTNPDEELLDLIGKHVYEQCNLRPTREQVSSALRGLPIPPGGPTPASSPEESAPTTNGLIVIDHPHEATGKRIRAFELWGHRYETGTWKQLLVEVVEQLRDRHGTDFDRILELRPRGKPWASRTPTEFRVAHEIGKSGVFVETSLSSVNSVLRTSRFLEHFGHPATDVTVWVASSSVSAHPSPGEPTRKRAHSSARTAKLELHLWGETYYVHTWKELLTQVALSIRQRHHTDFDRILELRGRKRPFASRDPADLIRSEQVGETGIFIDVNLSAKDIVRRAHLFLKHFGYPASDLEVVAEPRSATD